MGEFITFGPQFEVDTDANAVSTYIVQLTSTTGICFYSSSTIAVAAKHLTLTGDTITAGAKLTIDATATATHFIRAVRINDTKAIVTYFHGITHRARVVTVTGTTLSVGGVRDFVDSTNINSTSIAPLGNSTVAIYVYSSTNDNNGKAVALFDFGGVPFVGARFTYDTNCFNSAVIGLSNTKAIVVFTDASNNDLLTGEVLNVTLAGLVVTGNADQTLSTVAASQSGEYKIAIDALDSERAVVIWDKSANDGSGIVVISEDANTLSSGDTVVFAGAYSSVENISISSLTSSRVMGELGRTGAANLIFQLYVFANTSVEVDRTTVIGSAASTSPWIAAFDEDTAIATDPDDSPASAVTAIAVLAADDPVPSLAPMFKPADVDIDGGFIYVSLLLGGEPILMKISTGLTISGSIVFNPGLGDNIGVQCSRQDVDTLWVAGNFGGTNVIEISEDAGDTFTVIDDATIGDVRTFIVGPDSESRIIVFDETNGDLLETIDGGTTWVSINAAVTPEVNTIARLGTNVQESVFGNDGGANNSINYSVNSGTDLEDFQTGVYPNADSTRVIVN